MHRIFEVLQRGVHSGPHHNPIRGNDRVRKTRTHVCVCNTDSKNVANCIVTGGTVPSLGIELGPQRQVGGAALL